MLKKVPLLIYFSLKIIVFATSSDCPDPMTNFYADDTSYCYSVTIQTKLQSVNASKCLFSHEAQRYFNRFADSIYFDDIDSFTQICEINFSYLLYHGDARYRRVLYPGDSIIVDLERFEHNWSAIPKLKYAFIRYYFTTFENGCSITYYQRVIINKKFGPVYRKMAERQLRSFTRRLSEYLERCKECQD